MEKIATLPEDVQTSSLRRARLRVGVLTYGMQHSICYDLWRGMHAVAHEHAIHLRWFVGDQVRCPFGGFRDQANVVYELANAQTIDGLIIWGGALTPHLTTEETRAFYARYAPLPVVSLSYALPDVPSVVAGNYQGMRDALLHLIEVHSARRIIFMRGPVSGVEAEERYRAYVDVLRDHNLPHDPDLVLLGNNEAAPAQDAVIKLLDARKLRPGVDFDALVAANDIMAMSVLEVFQARGIRVPQDTPIIGFDDVGHARASTPPLTTVRYAFNTLGRQALNVLLAMFAGEDVPGHIVVPLELIVRQSCGCIDVSVAQAAGHFESGAVQPNHIPMARWSEDVPETEIASRIEQVKYIFRNELRNQALGGFQEVLQEMLRQTIAADQEPEIWHDVISALRQQFDRAREDESVRTHLENLCQQARVIIGQAARRMEEAKRLRSAEQEQILREIMARLITTFEVDRLMQVLAEELPRLEIPSCYLAVYDDPQPYAYPQPVPEWARLLLAYHDEQCLELPAGGARFPTRQLAPESVLPSDQRADLIVMPVYFQDRQIGFVVFAAVPREGTVYHALRTEISSALQGALLVQRVQEHAAEIARQKYVLDTFMATVPDSIYFKDRVGRIIQANQAHASALGFGDPAAEIGKTDFDFFAQELAQVKYEQEQQIIRTGQPILAMEEAGNEGQWALTTKMPLRNEHGEIIGTFGISRDITRLKQTEQELLRYQNHLEDLVKERTAELRQINARLNAEVIERIRAEEARRAGEQQYRMLAEYVKDGILIVQGGQLVFVNTALAEIVGYPIERILQQNPLNLFADHAQPQVSAYLARADADAANTGWQVELKTGDGRTIWTEIEETPIVWNSQFALLLTVRNIQHTKLREIRLEEERARLRQENLTFRSALTERYRFGPLVGKSPAMQRIYELVVNAATSGVNVLVVGESGTGKELIARTIHQVSRRKEHPFVPVNCASIPETLFEREFFGHRKGAFTGADRDTPGLFDRAHQGILFLDEVTELTPGMQAKLLRVLQDGEYTPLGSNLSKRADVMIVAATNKDCRSEIEAKRLRQDFFYRIAVIEISVPPLRERREDLPLLIEHLLDQYQQKQTDRKRRNLTDFPTDQTMLPAELVQSLYAYSWPGNVRELQNVLQRYLATQDVNVILNLSGVVPRAISLPEATRFSEQVSLIEAVQAFEKQLLAEIWTRNGYHTNRTAEQLGIPRRTLSHKLAQHHLKKPRQ